MKKSRSRSPRSKTARPSASDEKVARALVLACIDTLKRYGVGSDGESAVAAVQALLTAAFDVAGYADMPSDVMAQVMGMACQERFPSLPKPIPVWLPPEGKA